MDGTEIDGWGWDGMWDMLRVSVYANNVFGWSSGSDPGPGFPNRTDSAWVEL